MTNYTLELYSMFSIWSYKVECGDWVWIVANVFVPLSALCAVVLAFIMLRYFITISSSSCSSSSDDNVTYLRRENSQLKSDLMELSSLESVHLARIAELECLFNEKDGHDRL